MLTNERWTVNAGIVVLTHLGGSGCLQRTSAGTSGVRVDAAQPRDRETLLNLNKDVLVDLIPSTALRAGSSTAGDGSAA